MIIAMEKLPKEWNENWFWEFSSDLKKCNFGIYCAIHRYCFLNFYFPVKGIETLIQSKQHIFISTNKTFQKSLDKITVFRFIHVIVC